MPTPLHALPKSLERWLPKFNPDDGLPTEEHIQNFMLDANLNGVVEEDCVLRLFLLVSGYEQCSTLFPHKL